MQSEPVWSANGIVAAVSAVIAALIAFGVIDWSDDQRAAFMAAVVAVLGVVGPSIAAWWIRRQTTPLADPKDADGAPLSRSDNSPTIAQVRAAKIRWQRGQAPWPKR